MSAEHLQALYDDRADSELMVGLLVALLQNLDLRQVVVAFEWPLRAIAWKKPFKALEDLLRLLPITLEFDGCMYGWVTQKPWRVQTNSIALQSVLNRRCDQAESGHEHLACRGRVAEESGKYTSEMANVIADAICSDMAPLIAPLDDEDGEQPLPGQIAVDQDPAEGAVSSESAGAPLG